MAKEVSCKILDTVFGAVEAKGLDVAIVTIDTDLTLEHLRNPKERIDWSEFAQIFRNIRVHGGFERQDFINIGLGIFDTPVLAMLGVIARTLYSLPEFYLWYHNQDKSKVNKSLTSCVYTECSHDTQLNYIIRLHLLDDAEPIEEFFLTSLGVVMGWPKVYGLDPVDVEMTHVPHGCEYRFRCPRTGGPLSGLRKILMWPFTAKASAEHLVLANNEVYEHARQLEVENEKLKITEKKLQQAIVTAERASMVKTNFINNITHEIRTPLNAVMGLNSLCLESESTRNNPDTHLMMQTAIDRLVFTFEDIIEFNLLSDDAATLRPSTKIFSTWLSQHTATMARSATDQGIEFTLDNQVPHDLAFYQDWNRVGQVLRILLSNALKFTTEGKIAVSCQISPSIVDKTTESFDAETATTTPSNLNSDRQGQTTQALLTITVSDTGKGIDHDKLQVLFEPMHSIERSWTRANTGIGLGLPLAKASLEQMNGQISVTDNKPQGSCFIVTIPVTKGVALPTKPERKLEILLAEDNQVNAIIFKRMAELLGHNIHIVENGLLATEFVQKHPVDLVLMDLMMPVMDGVSASKIIRQQFSEEALPIVAVSANITPQDFDGLLNIGINQCATKPLNIEMFRSLIRPYQDEAHLPPNSLANAHPDNAKTPQSP